jgi:hypothetical protein
MARDVAGSIRKVTLEGVSYRATADANFSRKPTKVENTMIPTSGKAMRKIMRVTPVAEGVVLTVNTEEMEAIKALAESLDSIKISYTVAAGDVYRCVGAIEVEAHESEENKANVTFQPEDDWTLFPA